MAITRTAMVDDDGSGTTGTIINNAWKTELYNQIDAAGAGASASFTPTDASGASLAFTTANGLWVTIGPVVVAVLNVVYPTTANGSQAFVTLPAGGGTGLFQAGTIAFSDYGSPFTAYVPSATNKIGFATFAGAVLTNVMLSGKTVHMTVTYFK
jgi:hypothetical protein